MFSAKLCPASKLLIAISVAQTAESFIQRAVGAPADPAAGFALWTVQLDPAGAHDPVTLAICSQKALPHLQIVLAEIVQFFRTIGAALQARELRIDLAHLQLNGSPLPLLVLSPPVCRLRVPSSWTTRLLRHVSRLPTHHITAVVCSQSRAGSAERARVSLLPVFGVHCHAG